RHIVYTDVSGAANSEAPLFRHSRSQGASAPMPFRLKTCQADGTTRQVVDSGAMTSGTNDRNGSGGRVKHNTGVGFVNFTGAKVKKSRAFGVALTPKAQKYI